LIPAPFGYEVATSLDGALDALASSDGSLKVVAGGQSLLPLMKLRLARPERLLDISRIETLHGIRRLDSGGLAIGALTTWADVLADERAVAYAALAEAIATIGDLQVRNRGTIGGSLAHADPAADIAAPALALDFELIARSTRGERSIASAEFFLGPFTTALAPDELLTEIRIPPVQPGAASAYRFIAQPASGYPIAGVAVALVGRREPPETPDRDARQALDREGRGDAGPVGQLRIAVTGVADTPYRATAAEAALLARAEPSEAAGLVADGQQVLSDIHADAEYRTTVARVMARRAIEAALAEEAEAVV
jgi:carbon-monoxide dehydrogenase medium subunit